MSYKVAAVRALTNPNSEHNKQRDEIIAELREAQWKYWLDDTPVAPKLYEYGMELKKVYPSLQFWSSTKVRHWGYVNDANMKPMFVAHEVYICIPSSSYSLAWIGQGKYQAKDTAAYMYVVAARGINNEKYHSGRDQYHMKMSSNLKVAVKNALANLIPCTAQEIAEFEYGKFRSKSQDVGAGKAAKLPKLLGVVSHSVLMNEVRALHAAGVVFTTPEFQSIVDNMDEAVQLANAERSKRVNALLVNFSERSNGMVAECIEVEGVRTNYNAEFKENSKVTYELDKVPQFIVEKVAVLQGLDNGDHVDGVGMKVDAKVFWVEK
jgi:hypothetical protein